MNVVEFADLKKLLDLEKAEITDYPALELLVDSVKAAFEEFLGRKLDMARRTETVEIYSRTKMIPLEGLPIKSVTTVTRDGSAFTDYNTTNFGLRLGTLVSIGTFEVTYKGGFDKAPEWLKRAGLLQVAYEYQNKDHIGADYVQTEGGSVGRPALGLLAEVKRMLSPHRHPLNRMF